MEELLIGYVLNALDERSKCDVERYLHTHPEARAALARLQLALTPLAADKEAPVPPPQLAERTIARIAEHICAPDSVADLPSAPPVSPSVGGARSWWRRIDVLVAAALLLTFVGISLTVLARLRGPSEAAVMAECKNNLRVFFSALHAYRDVHGQFPDVTKEAPRDVAGMVVPILADAGSLSSTASIRCPAIGAPLTCQLTLVDLRKMNDEGFEKHAANLSMCYAYSLGYGNANLGFHGPGDVPKTSWRHTPIMADRPPAEGVPFNSMNHDRKGQNVLFADGVVQFLTDRKRAGDDIFLNRNNCVAAGIDASDIVLGYSGAKARP